MKSNQIELEAMALILKGMTIVVYGKLREMEDDGVKASLEMWLSESKRMVDDLGMVAGRRID